MQSRKDQFFEGKAKEALFRNMFDGMTESSPEDDVKRKFDMTLELNIDFKGLKRKDRSGAKDENIHWIELKNVRGSLGWLYGDADLFVFEVNDYYIMIWKEALQDLIQKKVVKEEDEKGNPIFKKEFYKLWNRKGRMDLITMVPTIDLCAISMNIIEKESLPQTSEKQ